MIARRLGRLQGLPDGCVFLFNRVSPDHESSPLSRKLYKLHS